MFATTSNAQVSRILAFKVYQQSLIKKEKRKSQDASRQNTVFERKEETFKVPEHGINGGKMWALKYLGHTGDTTNVSGIIKIEQKVWK